MDNRAAAQYLDIIFGTRAGHVAVAYKDKGQGWQESTFAWPSEKAKLLGWAKVHADTNVFICPALRQDPHTRKKGDMRPSNWLWADVDWQGVPADRKADVEARIKELGTLVIRSGTGDNVHVYVKLSKDVDHTQFIKLNTGLRDYLYADSKQADNSLLRLPGTTNWKSPEGSPVRRAGGVAGPAVSPEALLKRRVFRDARVIEDADASEWTYTSVEGLPRRVRSMVNLSVPEAEARYGNRHKAVWAITGELNKRGFSVDEIHSLMDRFPPALDKMSEENGYDVHRDVDKRLAYDRATISLTAEEAEEIEDEAIQLATEEDETADYEARILRLAMIELERSEARRKARTLEAERSWVAPPDDVSWSLTDALSRPPQPTPHLIDGLCGVKHNVVLTAQYKTGKTAFVMGSIAASLVDAQPFLDQFEVKAEGGLMVGHWNCEMDPHEMMDDYIRPVGIENTDNLHVANLRGYRVNILSEPGKAWAVNWLTTRSIKVWTIDSFARLARMAGVSEKDNDEVMSLLMALDQIKIEAGVDVLFLITHTGRAEQEEGKERARGATAIDDWADARWIMTKMDKARFLRVEGRGVGLEDSALDFDPDTKRSVLGFGGKEEVKNDGGVQTIIRVIKENPGCTQTELYAFMKGKASQRLTDQFIEDAIEGNFIEVRQESRGRGRAAKCHYLLGYEKPEGDRARRATPADTDMRGVKIRRPGRVPTS